MSDRTVLRVEIIAIGSELGIVLPLDLLEHLDVVAGDTVVIGDVPGGIQLSPLKSEHSEVTKVFRQVMRENREVLKRLADS